eukprot:CAMPEP_0113484520 /NCGR_PEP_ID=MMETSP0014_2-20120614/24002_1 /TAXON_ID=2857 /ORGANISM="Nitzschia sp." /LENGTH=236 /DNA_ID=CAMNT_0000378121 /DNA_START=169 /DNA_END=877 /DNA_ORIENTATION=+ /assembly_acc=CAM_ASM_000159
MTSGKGTGTSSTVLLGLTPTWVTDEEGSVIFYQSLSQVILRLFINVLGVVGNDRLGDGGPDGVDLCSDTSTFDTDTDVQVGELVLSQDQDRFKDLKAHALRLDVLDGLSIDLDKTPALLGKGNSGCRLFPVRCDVKRQKRNKVRKRFMTKTIVIESPSPQQFLEPHKELHDTVTLLFPHYHVVSIGAIGVASDCDAVVAAPYTPILRSTTSSPPPQAPRPHREYPILSILHGCIIF